MRFTIPALLIALLLSPLAQAADNWPSWRGPEQTGVAAKGTYPTQWSAEKNVAFKLDLPGRGSSTPVVWGEHIFVTAAEPEQGNVLLAYDMEGKQQWMTTIGEDRPGKHKKASGANSSPVTDGEHVFAYYKSGDLAAVTLEGKVAWRHNLQEEFGEDTLWWDLGTSPVLTEDFIVVAVMQSGPSYLVAYEKDSGKLAWKQDRVFNAPKESTQSYSTPVVVTHEGREMIVVLGADHVTAHDAATGTEIWRLGGLNPTGHQYFRSIASPVVSEGVIVAPYGRGATLLGVKLAGQGDVTKSNTLWNISGDSPDVPSPAAANGRVYVLSDKGLVRTIDLSSGELINKLQLPKHRRGFSASPVLAGGHLYCTREDGATLVVKVGDELSLVAVNELDDDTVATPVFVDGKILLRTYGNLYCFGE